MHSHREGEISAAFFWEKGQGCLICADGISCLIVNNSYQLLAECLGTLEIHWGLLLLCSLYLCAGESVWVDPSNGEIR